MKPKAKNIETKIKGFSQNQEFNNSGFECILLVSTRVLNFTTSTWCQLLMHISTLLCSHWTFFHIFGLFQVGECFFLQFFFISQWWWIFAKKHILHWNMLFPSFFTKGFIAPNWPVDSENVEWGTLYIPILPPQQNKLFYKLHHVCWIYQPSLILCNESLIRGTNLNVNASGVFGHTWCTIYAFICTSCNLQFKW
jgi:hypothetical protein